MSPASADPILFDGYRYLESPRWHEGALWFADCLERRVMRMAPGAAPEPVFSVEDVPSGLGFLPGGDVLVVGMLSRKLLRWDGSGVRAHGRLDEVARGTPNDMVVAPDGRAYVGDMGFAMGSEDRDKPGSIVRVDPDGTTARVADDVGNPNGLAIDAARAHLFVAESTANRLARYDLGADGSLSGLVHLAEFPGRYPDGICVDAEGSIWVAMFTGGEIVRFASDGAVQERIELVEPCGVACVLGDPDRRTLYELVSDAGPMGAKPGNARIRTRRVEVPGAGWP